MRYRWSIVSVGALALAAGVVGQAERRSATGSAATVVRGGPANGADSCVLAPVISGFGNFPWDNVGASVDGQDHGLCAKDGDAGIHNDLWWRWQSPTTGPVTVSTCGLTTVDTEIAIYGPQALCAPGDEALIACDDQNCSDQTEITFLAVAGQEYLIRLGGYDGFQSTGSGEFSIAAPGISPCDPAYCQDFDAMLSFGWNSDLDIQVADDFTAPSDSYVCFVCVKGDYDTSEPSPPVGDLFEVRYFADNGGVPGIVLAVFEQGVNLLVEGPVPTGELVKGEYTQFEHKLKHLPVFVGEGQRVWVEVRNLVSGDWYWSSSPEGNGEAYLAFTIGGYGPEDAIESDLTMCVGPIETCATDVDGDGDTDFGDLNFVVSSFNTTCP
jgi:hypothetical protein